MKTLKLQFKSFSLPVLAAVIFTACDNRQQSATPPAPPAATAGVELPADLPKPPAIKPAKTTSYAQVTAKLDRGGNVFGYLGTAQWLDGLSGKIGEFEQLALKMAPDEEDVIKTAFKLITGLVKRSGLEELSGVGVSTVQVGEEQFRSRLFMHHDASRNQGYLWNMFGGKPHELTGLNLMPEDAVIASYSDIDVKALWKTVLNELVMLGTPEVRESLSAAPEQFKMMTGMELDAFLDSLGGEFGWALMLNEAIPFTIPMPSPSGSPMKMPQPELMLVAKANDKLIFDRISLLVAKMPNVRTEQDGEVHKVLIPPPVPFVPALQPVLAFDGEHLFIVSSPGVLKKALAAKAGGPSLRTNEQFKSLAAHLPAEGNSFTFLSDRLGKEYMKFQQNLMPSGGNLSSGQFGTMIQKLGAPTFAASVFQNTEEGWLTTSVGNQSVADALSVGTVAVVGVIAAIAIPNFVKARATAQKNACIANLKQLHGATQQWALEHQKKVTDKPHRTALLEYLHRGRMPECPGGGTYELPEQVRHSPTCTIPGHAL